MELNVQKQRLLQQLLPLQLQLQQQQRRQQQQQQLLLLRQQLQVVSTLCVNSASQILRQINFVDWEISKTFYVLVASPSASKFRQPKDFCDPQMCPHESP